MTTEPWASVEDVAKHLGVAKDSVYRWIESRHLPAHKIGRLWKFKLSEVARSGRGCPARWARANDTKHADGGEAWRALALGARWSVHRTPGGYR